MTTRLLRAISATVVAAGAVAVALPGTAAADTTDPRVFANSATDRATTQRLSVEAAAVQVVADPKARTSGSARVVTASATGTYPTRRGTFMSTNSKVSGVIPIGHSAMVYSSSYTVEANASNGVAYGSNNWYSKSSGVWGMTTRATTVTQDTTAGNWANSQRGKPYNWNFYNMGTRTSFYCSQLVWAAFNDTAHIDLNTSAYDIVGLRAIAPMEFPSSADSSKIAIIYYKS